MDSTIPLFSPFTLRSITFKNRIAVSPMCQYSSKDGFANEWHLVHLGGYAVGGAGLVITEAAAIAANGRISPEDLGIWSDEHIAELKHINEFLIGQGSVPGIQLAHAGRKASTRRPWLGRGQSPVEEGGWTDAVGPSAIPFDTLQTPHELSGEGIAGIVTLFREAAVRSLKAGFQVVELHGAHGYLLHQFLSPLSNLRTDDYGGSFENRTRIVHEVVQSVREVWPNELPLFLRLSATDWVDGGWTLDETVRLAKEVHPMGVDLIDCSSGGAAAKADIPVGRSYQVPFAAAVKAAGVPSGAVGLITEPVQANDIVVEGSADLVFIAREFLRDPRWVWRAAQTLGVDLPWVPQYERAKLFA